MRSNNPPREKKGANDTLSAGRYPRWFVFAVFVGGWLSHISWERRASFGFMAAFLEWLSYAIMIALPLLFFLGMIVRASDALTKIEVRLKESTEQLKEIGNELARREVH